MGLDAEANARATVRDFLRKSSLFDPDVVPKVTEGIARTIALLHGAKLIVDEDAPSDHAEALAREEAGEPFAHWYFTSEKLEAINELIFLAGSDATNWRACIYVVEGFIKQGDPLPKELGEFVVSALLGQQTRARQRGRPASENRVRDFLIAMAVYRATKCGLNPTRNEASTEKTSACQIVSEVLGEIGQSLSEQSVSRIWGQFAHLR